MSTHIHIYIYVHACGYATVHPCSQTHCHHAYKQTTRYVTCHPLLHQRQGKYPQTNPQKQTPEIVEIKPMKTKAVRVDKVSTNGYASYEKVRQSTQTNAFHVFGRWGIVKAAHKNQPQSAAAAAKTAANRPAPESWQLLPAH